MVMGLMARSSQAKERWQDSNASICFCERHLQYITSGISVDDSWIRQVRTIHEGLQPVLRKEAGYIRMAWSSLCHIVCYLLPIVVLRPWLVCCMHIHCLHGHHGTTTSSSNLLNDWHWQWKSHSWMFNGHALPRSHGWVAAQSAVPSIAQYRPVNERRANVSVGNANNHALYASSELAWYIGNMDNKRAEVRFQLHCHCNCYYCCYCCYFYTFIASVATSCYCRYSCLPNGDWLTGITQWP